MGRRRATRLDAACALGFRHSVNRFGRNSHGKTAGDELSWGGVERLRRFRPINNKGVAMTEQGFSDGMLWCFAVAGGLLFTFFIIFILMYCVVNIVDMVRDYRRKQMRIKYWRADQWQTVRRKS